MDERALETPRIPQNPSGRILASVECYILLANDSAINQGD